MVTYEDGLKTCSPKERQVFETEVDMGTVHPAALEPYRVRLFVEDEIVKDAEIHVGINHRGIERIMEGLPVEKGNALTEKVCGICSNAHIWNSCRAGEGAIGIEVPERAIYIRVLMEELERLHSHMLYLAHGSEVLSHETFSMRIFYIRESVMDLLRMMGGNRVQYGASVLGGIRPRADLDAMRTQKILETMDYLEDKVGDFVNRFVRDPMVMSRITGTGQLSQKEALKREVTGPTLRATGYEFDLRREMPEYEPFEFDVITQDTCDVKANIVVRALEIFEAIKIIRQVLKDVPEGPVVNRDWEMVDSPVYKSYIEVPRGRCYHSYGVENGRMRHVIIRTPSMSNIGAMQESCIGHPIQDAQLCIVSCDPCFTCTDRAIQVIRL
ncbi:MAG: nickel-dependent hydrogenase large subunit [Methanobacteriaceae archaeon]|nr:nickel-dependent hydrogenase large subunit [Methanobacteriaceae archaeon]